MAWVYGIQSGLFIKVGWATDIKVRLQAMALYNPHPVKVVLRRRVVNACWVEKHMHRTLASHGIGREWFATDPKTVRDAFNIAHRALMEKRTGDALWATEKREKHAQKLGLMAQTPHGH